MNAAYVAMGAALLGVSITDLLWTTLWVDGGAGPVSSRLTSGIWRGLRSIGEGGSTVISVSGPVIITGTLGIWFGLIWAGWTFVFAGGGGSLIDTQGGGPVGWVDHVYFTGYAMFTLGNGDFVPADGTWQILTVLTTASGMLFVTLSVSYLLSVLGAVVDKRSFADDVAGIGDSRHEFVRTAWNGDDFRELDLPLDDLATQLNHLAEQHRAYPVLHYYHGDDVTEAAAASVALFDEALTLLRFGVDEPDRTNATLLKSARSSVNAYLETLAGAFIEPTDDPPPPPDLDPLRNAGVPTVSDAAYADALADLADRRRKLLAMVTADGWEWPPGENQ